MGFANLPDAAAIDRSGDHEPLVNALRFADGDVFDAKDRLRHWDLLQARYVTKVSATKHWHKKSPFRGLTS